MYLTIIEKMRVSVAIALFLIISCPCVVQAAQSGEEISHPAGSKTEEMLEHEFPQTKFNSELDLSLKPNASDAIKEDYIRSPMSIKYGITDNWEVSLEPQTYFDNFLRGHFGLYMTDVMLGTKYSFGTITDSGLIMAFSFKEILPVRDDIRISDGYNHNIPAIHFSWIVQRYTPLVIGLTLSENIVTGYGPEGSAKPNDTLITSLGAHYRARKVNYTMESIYVTDEPYGGVAENAYVAPGLSLDVKDWLDGIPGVWTFALGVRFWFLDSEDQIELIGKLKLNLRLGYKFDFNKMEWKSRN